MLKAATLALSLVCAGAPAQVSFRLGPLECTPPSGYSLTGQRRDDRLLFVGSSPRLEVALTYGQAREDGPDVWARLARLHEARRAAAEVAEDARLPEPKQTRWLDLPALLGRIDEQRQGQTRHRMVLTALDARRQLYFQMEIAFAPQDSGTVQKALESWAKSVRYLPQASEG